MRLMVIWSRVLFFVCSFQLKLWLNYSESRSKLISWVKSGLLFVQKKPSYGSGDRHYKPKTVWRPPQVYDGNPRINKVVCSLWIEAQIYYLNQYSMSPLGEHTDQYIYISVGGQGICMSVVSKWLLMTLMSLWLLGAISMTVGPMCLCGSFGASFVYMGVGWDGVHTLNRYCWPGLLHGR